MNNVVLFCKSYQPDMLRARRLAESIQRFNQDEIPLVMSVPAQDFASFEDAFQGIPCTFITDEQILERSRQAHGEVPAGFEPHYHMMLSKLEFWRMAMCRYYVWIDSDAYFIRPFGMADFFFDQDTPYIIKHRLREIRAFDERYHRNIISNFENESRRVQKAFGRDGECFDFGSPPVIWSCGVLESLYEDYLKPNQKTIFELILELRHDSLVYGEYFMHSGIEKAVQREQLFKVFHYAEQFFESQMLGEWEYSLAKDYAGIIIQSNWSSIRTKKKKTLRDRLRKTFGK